MSAFLEQLNKSFFWDIDPSSLDENKSSRLIIERVMNYGDLNDIHLVKKNTEKRKLKEPFAV